MITKAFRRIRDYLLPRDEPNAVFIGGVPIGKKFPVFFIAEIGINHNGSIETAKKLIDAAATAGAQAVKFQKRTIPVVYTSEELAKPRAVDRGLLENAVRRGVLSKEAEMRLEKSDYAESTNGDLKWALEFTEREYRDIFNHAKGKGLLVFASPWDEESVDVLERLGVPCHKVASASLTDHGLLKKLKSTEKPIILSTGMSTVEEILEAVEVLGKKDTILLHTVSTYPATTKEINLKAIRTLKMMFPHMQIGYSGHEGGTATSVAAATLGARVIERHITLDKQMFGTDQSASLEPQEFQELIAGVRAMEEAFGDGVKRVFQSEIPIREKLRRK